MVMEYEMVAVPAVTPVVIPVLLTVAISDELVAHTPPGALLLSVMEDPIQTESVPVMLPTTAGMSVVTFLPAVYTEAVLIAHVTRHR